MTRVKMSALRAMSGSDLQKKITEARAELARLRTDASKGTLRKENGKIKAIKRDIARMLTRMTELEK